MGLSDNQYTRAITSGLLLSLVGLTPLQADDKEIFFGQNSDSFNNNPNILFVLDNSGSMSVKDEGFNNLSRIDRLKTAMSTLLDQSSSYNVGLMAFQGRDHVGAIRYPVGYLESESTERCDGICPDELIVARPDGGGNDGTEHDSTNEVTLDSLTLVMANIDSTTTDTTDTTAVETTLSAIATADVSEYTPAATGVAINQNNQSINTWFYNGVADNGIGHHAYRFDNIQIPRDATVTQAMITFTQTAKADQSGDLSTYISAEATLTPQAYPTGSNGTLSLAERRNPLRRTNELVAWNPVPPDNSSGATADTTTSLKVDTPDISSLISELVSQPGWGGGGSMSFLVDPFDSYIASAAVIRKFHGSAPSADMAPVLTYTFHEAPNPDLTSTSVIASAHVDEISAQNTEIVSSNTVNEVSQLFYASASNQPMELALRFDGINIPSDAIIKNAYLTMTWRPWTRQRAPSRQAPEASGRMSQMAPV